MPSSPHSAERLWLSPGPVCGGGDAGCVLGYGPAVVCGGHRALHLPCEQPEAGVGVFGTRRAAQIPGHSRAALYWLDDLHPDGLLCLYDICAEGQWADAKMFVFNVKCTYKVLILNICFQFIPMPVLYGVFLYMGASSLRGIQVHSDSLC